MFDYINDTEPGFDFGYVFVDSTGGSMEHEYNDAVISYNGSVSGEDTVQLTPGQELPTSAGDVTIMFCVEADVVWSDEDGLYSTDCGAFAVDNIRLTGGITHFAGFETGDDGWEVGPPPPAQGSGGEWSDIRAVSDLPAEPGSAGCDLGDSVLVMFDEFGSWNHPCRQINSVTSPWIDLAEVGAVGSPGYVIEFGGFFNLPLANWNFVIVEAQWFPDTCPFSGIPGLSEFTSTGDVYYISGPRCADESDRVRIDFTDIIPSHAEEIRIALGLYNGGQGFFCEGYYGGNSTPWFDGVRFGMFDTSGVTVGVPDTTAVSNGPLLGYFTPNPYLGTHPGLIPFALSEEGPARVEIYDISGRLVKTVFGEVAMPGLNEAHWNGTDLSGRQVPSGIYLYRLVAENTVRSRKLVLIRD
jgi:hypothetical protein